MFKRLILVLALAGAPLAAVAQSVQDEIISQLHAQGFNDITLNRTWLGRVRVIAVREDLRRELVFNPQTGEILRDYWVTIGAEDLGTAPRLVNPGSTPTNNASGGDDDRSDANDDRNDDDKDDTEDDHADEDDDHEADDD